MDEHSRRATRTPNFPIPLFEQRCSGDVYPKAKPDFLAKKERTHIFLLFAYSARSAHFLNEFRYSNSSISVVFITSQSLGVICCLSQANDGFGVADFKRYLKD